MLSYKYELQHNLPYTSYLSHHMIRITATSMTLMAGFIHDIIFASTTNTEILQYVFLETVY